MNKQQQIEIEKQKIVEARRRIGELERKPEYLREFKEDELYFYAIDTGEGGGHFWRGDHIDKVYADFGNIFTKQDHAQTKVDNMKRYGRLERLIIEFNAGYGWEPDWDNESQEKGGLYFYHRRKEWYVERLVRIERIGQPVFDYSRKDELLATVNKHFPNGFES